MPTSLSGFVFVTLFLTPGFILFIQRGKLAPQKILSPLYELVGTVAASVAIDIFVYSIYGLARLWRPHVFPNLLLIFSSKISEITNLNSSLAWMAVLFAVSCLLAFLIGINSKFLRFVIPIIIDGSSWYFLFTREKTKSVFVGCDLVDGSYVIGYLTWFNTHPDDIQDRDLILQKPLTVIKDGVVDSNLDFDHMIISARQISKIYVSYISTT